jgi:hypothetical protein
VFCLFLVVLFQISYAEWKDHPKKPLETNFQSNRTPGFEIMMVSLLITGRHQALVAMEIWILLISGSCISDRLC